MRKMYDSVTAAHIPPDAQIVAGYVSGPYRWSDADWARFPHAIHVGIATQSYVMDGIVLDVEKGDATPAQAPGWVSRRRAAGFDPTIYCSASVWQTVIQTFVDAGMRQPHYWVAHYDGIESIPDGAIAKQYKNPPSSGGHFDLSIVADFWPGVDTGNSMSGEIADTQIAKVPVISGAQIGRPGLEAAYVWTDIYGFCTKILTAVTTLQADVTALKNALPPNGHIAFVPEGQITVKPIITE